jgi:hypothetical protein
MTVNDEGDGLAAVKDDDEGEIAIKNCDKGKELRFYRLIIPYNL